MIFEKYTLDILALQCLGIICIPFVIGTLYNILLRIRIEIIIKKIKEKK